MYCSNCGNKVDEKAYICVNCGVILQKERISVQKKERGNGLGIASMILGILSTFLCLSTFLVDISEVGMYTKLVDRFYYAVGFNFIQIILTIISLCLGLSSKKNGFSKAGVVLSFISIFLVITEFVIILIY